MKVAMYVIGLVVFLLILGAVYVRVAPTDVARWHHPIEARQSADFSTGAARVIPADAAAFERVAAAASDLPRTQVIAGSISDGRVTYLTRSKWVGFPDFTTVEYADGTLKMLARLRFGQSDLGVNAARLKGLLVAAQQPG